MAINQQFVSSKVREVLRAGPANSSNPLYAQLKADLAAVSAKISAGQGKQVVSVNAGESASWQLPPNTDLFDLHGAYSAALDWLDGATPLVRQTTSIFLG